MFHSFATSVAVILVLLRYTTAKLKEHVSEAELNSIRSSHSLVLVAFLHEASDASNIFLEDYKLAASATDQLLLTVDCVAEQALCRDQDVNAYPAVRLYTDSSVSSLRYRGPRNARSILSFITKQSLPPAFDVTEVNLNLSFKTIDDIVFVAYVEASDTELISVYTEIAEFYHDSFVFGLCTSPSLAAREHIIPPAVVSYQNINGQISILTSVFDAASLAAFITDSSTPLIAPLTRRNIDTYISLRKPILYIFLPRQPPSLDSTLNDDLLRAVSTTAKVYGPYVSFVHVDAVEYAHMGPMLELRSDTWPAVVMHDVVRDRVWVYPQDEVVEAGKVEELVLGVLKGEIEPTPPGTGVKAAMRKEKVEETENEDTKRHDEL